MSPPASACACADSRHQAGFAVVAPTGRAGRRLLRVEAERDVEECRRGAGSTGPAGLRGAPLRHRQQVAVGGLVPQPDTGGEANGPAPGVPLAVRHLHRDLPPREIDAHAGRRTRHFGAGDRVRQHCGFTVDGQEVLRRRAYVGAEREGVALAFRSADGDRRCHQVGVLERVQRDAQRGRRGHRLDAQLDQVGRVFVIAGAARIVVGAVRRREQIAARGVATGRVHRIARVCDLLRAMIVVDVSLIYELTATVGAGAGDEDRRGVPHRAPFVFELGHVGWAFVEGGRPGARRCPFFGRQ